MGVHEYSVLGAYVRCTLYAVLLRRMWTNGCPYRHDFCESPWDPATYVYVRSTECVSMGLAGPARTRTREVDAAR